MAQGSKDAGGASSAKLVLPLTESGLVDWDRVRPSAAQKVLELMRDDPTIKAELQGTTSEDESETPDTFAGVTQENVGAAIDIIGRVNALVLKVMCGRFMQHPLFKDAKTGKPLPLVLEPQALSALQFTKKQHAELDPRATRIAKKYSGNMPEWLKKHLDLYMLGLMFLQYTAENAKTALEIQLRTDVEKLKTMQARQAPPGPQPTSDGKVNGRDHTPPPSFSGMTEPPVGETTDL